MLAIISFMKVYCFSRNELLFECNLIFFIFFFRSHSLVQFIVWCAHAIHCSTYIISISNIATFKILKLLGSLFFDLFYFVGPYATCVLVRPFSLYAQYNNGQLQVFLQQGLILVNFLSFEFEDVLFLLIAVCLFRIGQFHCVWVVCEFQFVIIFQTGTYSHQRTTCAFLVTSMFF
jgi:hypothetical protein